MFKRPRLFSLALTLLITLGAGCATFKPPTALDLPGWYIDFEEQGPWYAMQLYAGPGQPFAAPTTRSTARGEGRVWMQNSAEPVLIDGFKERTDLTYTDKPWVLVDVTAYPSAGQIPSYAVQETINGREMGFVERTVGADMYYWKPADRLYEMIVYTSDPSIDPRDILGSIVERTP